MSEKASGPTVEEIDALYQKLDEEAEAGGYHLNPDKEVTRQLVEGLLVNMERYGYGACPCRLASGDKEEDLDIICPCDYRDPDLHDYGTCYCALYVSEDVAEGKAEAPSIPERRPDEREERPQFTEPSGVGESGMEIWRCRVCGYLCARDNPPGRCPVCKASRERFEPLRLMVRLGNE
jgi:ferredoxin-thioredoxin reductase catalytic subunit/rubredoxin